MSRPEPPIDRYEGYRWDPYPDNGWRLVVEGKRGKRCRGAAGWHKPACGRPAVAEMGRRNKRLGVAWWAYCAEHLYGRWVEDGVVYGWRLVEDGEVPDGARP